MGSLFFSDLFKNLQSSLRASGDVRLADRRLKDLIRLAETFGFHCCSLDVRQESTVHSEVSKFLSSPSFNFKSSMMCDVDKKTPFSGRVFFFVSTAGQVNHKLFF